MDRVILATHIQSTIHYLGLKRWTPQQTPYAEALIRLLMMEREEILKLGLTELVNYKKGELPE